MHHKVRTTKWVNDVLVHDEIRFHDHNAAMEFARSIIDGYVKIYNEIDELLFSWECGNAVNHHSSYA